MSPTFLRISDLLTILLQFKTKPSQFKACAYIRPTIIAAQPHLKNPTSKLQHWILLKESINVGLDGYDH